MAKDPTHNIAYLVCCPQGGDCSLWTRTSRLRDSFIHQAVRKLNSLPILLTITPFSSHTPFPVTSAPFHHPCNSSSSKEPLASLCHTFQFLCFLNQTQNQSFYCLCYLNKHCFSMNCARQGYNLNSQCVSNIRNIVNITDLTWNKCVQWTPHMFSFPSLV